MVKDSTQFRQRFNRWKNGAKVYDAGKPISDDEYYSTMENVAKENWEKWGDVSEDAALTRILNANDYDYRGYYNKYPKSKANADTHWTDEFKTVYHPTFSEQSIYSGKKSKFNPEGLKGGSWGENDKFYPQNWQMFGTKYNHSKPIPKYDGGTGDKTYLPEYEYEATVTPQGVSLEKHKHITNEKDWLKYWGDVGAGYVNKAQESVAKPILDGLKTASYFTPLGNATAVGDFIAANINGGKDEILEAGAGLLPAVRWTKSSSKLLKDLITSPREVLSARRSGNYPLTFRERRDYITRQQRELDEAWDAVLQMQNDLASEHPKLFLPGRRIKRPKTIVGGDDVVKRMDFTDDMAGAFYPDRSIVASRRRMPGSLLPIKYKYGFKGNAAHEYQHAVRDYDLFITSEPFTIPTSEYYSLNPNSPVAPLFRDVVGKTGFNGKNRTPWQRDPNEFLSEYWSYRAASDPSGRLVPRFSESTPLLKKEVVDRLSRRFNLSTETVHDALRKISFYGGYDKGKPIKHIKCK